MQLRLGLNLFLWTIKCCSYVVHYKFWIKHNAVCICDWK